MKDALILFYLAKFYFLTFVSVVKAETLAIFATSTILKPRAKYPLVIVKPHR